jgi:YD repeat-containing protein
MALFLCLAFVSALRAQNSTPVQYFYDDLGRLTRVVDQSGNIASYNYDAVGNLLSISRSALPTNNGLAILNFTPQTGAVGTSVTIQGQGFSSTPTANAVQFNGTPATVTAAATSTLTVTVPTGATTGPISVTVAGTTATSDAIFTVAPLTLISISVTAINTTVFAGQTMQYRATGLYSNGSTQDLTTAVTWSAANTAIATVSNSSGTQGLVTGVSNGFTAITATSGSVSGAATVTVATVSGFTISSAGFCLATGTTQQFTAQAQYTNGTSEDVTANASWTSSNTAVATISNATGSQGVVTALATGVTTITANLQGLTASISISVAPHLISGWSQQDVGSVTAGACVTFANGVFTVNGSGGGLGSIGGGDLDSFHFVYQPLSGDGTIVARVISLQGSSPMAGVIIRGSLEADATYAASDYQIDGDLGPQFVYSYRASTDTDISVQISPFPGLTLPYWVKLVRSGNSFSGYTSPDGVNWTQSSSTQTIPMITNVYVGLAVSSGSVSSLATATFDNVSVNATANPGPVITAVSATTGPVGSQVLITGGEFGETQGGSEVLLSDTPVTINSWSDTSITITIPVGAISGYLGVSVAPDMNDSNPVYFTVTANPLPPGLLDQNVGTVFTPGSASYASGVFTISAAGMGVGLGSGGGGSLDSFHFVYQSLTGDGTIVARVVSTQGSSPLAGVMIRETLAGDATYAASDYQINGDLGLDFVYSYRAATDTDYIVQTGPFTPLPYWVKVVRSGNSFSGYTSADGLNWTQVGTTQTIPMATNVYVGLAVSSGSMSSLATATFDNVSITSTAAPGPAITAVSATTGSVGSQVVITGTGFGATQGGSEVALNGAPVTIDSWSATSITITIPVGATSGYLAVSVAPDMDESNPVYFTVTADPLPAGLLDQNVGTALMPGSATYASGVFTISAAGTGFGGGAADSFHFVYQPIVGDGTIVARLVSLEGGSSPQAGVMIRETLAGDATYAAQGYQIDGDLGFGFIFSYRTTTGSSNGSQTGPFVGLPYWVKVIRTGNSFSAYTSPDGVNWTQVGSTKTIPMATTVYVGLAVSSGSISSLATATFDNVSVAEPAGPAISSLSSPSGPPGAALTITGQNFGTAQGGSEVTINGAPATSVTSWIGTQIVVQVPTGATTGNVVVTVPGYVASNGVHFTVTGGYANGRAITISHTMVPNTDQTNFPVLVSGTYSFLATTANGGDVSSASGYDIIFTSDPDGLNVLPFEQESYSPTTGVVNYWVQVPTVSHTNDTVFYVFYGNPAITTDQSNKSAVWDSNYRGVWHLANGTILNASDSTGNGNNGTVQGGVMAAAGQIDGAGSFNGSSGYISTVNTFGWPLSSTNEAWINTTSTAGHKVAGLETNQTGAGSTGYDSNLYVDSTGRAVATCYNGSLVTVASSAEVNNGVWHHLVSTLNTSTNTLMLYVDGVTQGPANCSGTEGLTGYFRIGSYKLNGWPNGSDGYFSGLIDEVRFSNSARSADWISTEYNNQSNPSTFFDVGSSFTPASASLSPANRTADARSTVAQGSSADKKTTNGSAVGIRSPILQAH